VISCRHVFRGRPCDLPSSGREPDALPSLFTVDLRFNAMGRHGRPVFAHRRPKDPVEFRPRRVSIRVNRHTMRLKIACREHAAHDVLEDMPLDGMEAVVIAQRIDKRDLRGVRPNFARVGSGRPCLRLWYTAQ
jgi:hypothetical protein